MAASQQKVTTSAAETEALRRQLAKAHKTIAQMDRRIKAASQLQAQEVKQLNDQLTVALRAMGRARPQPRVAIELRSPA
jgi:hypothetical protein